MVVLGITPTKKKANSVRSWLNHLEEFTV